MSRVLRWAFVIGVVLLAAGLFADIAAPSSSLALPLVTASAMVFVAIVWMIFARAWRTKGWSIRHPGRFDERTPLE